MEIKNPILDIGITAENKDKIEFLKSVFEQLTPEEKFDVVELQNIMFQKGSKHIEMYGIPRGTRKAKRNENEIISQMSSRSLDYSHMCISYYVPRISSVLKK